MRQPITWGRRSVATLVAVGMVASAVTLTGATAASADPVDDTAAIKTSPVDILGNHDADLLAEAQASGEHAVTVIVATDKGAAGDVAAGLKGLGGSVSQRFDQAGYVLAQVPTGQVLKAARLAGVAAIDLDETIKVPVPTPDPGTTGAEAARRAAPVGPGAGTAAANPFMPAHETGAVDFRQKNPTFDGRGITIGIMDSGVDLASPALQKTTTGERKIVDWVTATDPLLDADGTWRMMRTPVAGPTFSYAGSAWKAPAGRYLMNRFTESITERSDPAGDVNRDGDKTDTFGVLYNPVTNDVRVDANQNLNFTDDAVMRPYKEKFDVGYFGTDNPTTAVQDRMPFVVEFREDVDLTPAGLPGEKADFVNIGIVESSHGSHVAGITAANDMLGNSNFDGAAPGARLVSSRACTWGGGCSASALVTGMVDLVVNRKVDVVNVSIGGLPALNDANNARARLYDQLINVYGVQLFISAGNSGPGLNTMGDPSVATDVVSVASGISKETWLANYGSVVDTAYALHNFSSRGPREDGGFKPNITAPGSAISTIPTWQPGSAAAETGYQLPPGYAMFNGTSMSSPQATGSAALLLSAGKASKVSVTPAALRRSIYSSATWIPGVPAYGQGNGMFNVNGAWNLLKAGVEARRYTSDAPVCTPLSQYLATAHRGTGIYNRCGSGQGGHRAGQSKSYQIRVTRQGGPDKGVTHRLTWVGNDGTFRSAGNVVIPLNRATNLSVTATPPAGAHAAILRIDDPATSTVDFEVLNTVVAAAEPSPTYAFATSGTVDRNLSTSFFLNVPPGATALQVNMSGIANGSQVRFIAINPYGVPVDSTASIACYPNYTPPKDAEPVHCPPMERDYQNPLPGVWEIEVEARRTTPALKNPFELAARVQGVTVSPSVLSLPTVKAGQATPVTWTATNGFGPITVSGQGGPLGSAATSRPSIKTGQTQQYEVVVPAGATRLDVAIGSPGDQGADLDLTVFLGEKQVGQSADGDSEESVSLPKPVPGTYTVKVAGYAVPTGTTEYTYRDAFFSPALGSITAAEAATPLATKGAVATITGAVTVKAPPAAGRSLSGEMTVVTQEGAPVGRGSLKIGTVI